MGQKSNIDYYRIRQIGWDKWDPIGLRQLDPTWEEEAADEYDSYVFHVVRLLQNGQSVSDAVAYLDEIASEHMGLGMRPGLHQASERTVEAIAEYLRILPKGPRT
jgi:hypothetical protein